MSTRALDSTVQKTHLWLEAVRGNLGGTASKDIAYAALRAVLHALRDRLPLGSIAHLSAQLPLLVRGVFFEGWHPADKPLRIRHAEDFLALVDDGLDGATVAADRAIVSVYRCLEQHLDPGEMDKLAASLPEEIRGLCSVEPEPE